MICFIQHKAVCKKEIGKNDEIEKYLYINEGRYCEVPNIIIVLFKSLWTSREYKFFIAKSYLVGNIISNCHRLSILGLLDKLMN